MNNEMLETIVRAVFTILGILITAYVIPWIKEKIGEEKYRKLIDYTEIAERAAKELFKDNENKREYVTNAIVAYANKNGISLESNTVRMILEGVYNLYKESINEGK